MKLTEARNSLVSLNSKRPGTAQQNDSKEEMELLRRGVEEVKSDRDYYKAQAEANRREIVEKTQEFTEKIQEIAEVKAKYQESLLKLAVLEEKVDFILIEGFVNSLISS